MRLVPEAGLEPTWALSPPDFESGAYTNFATPAELSMIRTRVGTVKDGVWSLAFGFRSLAFGLRSSLWTDARLDKVQNQKPKTENPKPKTQNPKPKTQKPNALRNDKDRRHRLLVSGPEPSCTETAI